MKNKESERDISVECNKKKKIKGKMEMCGGSKHLFNNTYLPGGAQNVIIVLAIITAYTK